MPKLDSCLSVEQMTLTEFFLTYQQGVTIAPDQRPFVWRASAVVSFLTQLKKGAHLGTVILEATPDGYQLIDGQQRLCSILVWLYTHERRGKDDRVKIPDWSVPSSETRQTLLAVAQATRAKMDAIRLPLSEMTLTVLIVKNRTMAETIRASLNVNPDLIRVPVLAADRLKAHHYREYVLNGDEDKSPEKKLEKFNKLLTKLSEKIAERRDAAELAPETHKTHFLWKDMTLEKWITGDAQSDYVVTHGFVQLLQAELMGHTGAAARQYWQDQYRLPVDEQTGTGLMTDPISRLKGQRQCFYDDDDEWHPSLAERFKSGEGYFEFLKKAFELQDVFLEGVSVLEGEKALVPQSKVKDDERSLLTDLWCSGCRLFDDYDELVGFTYDVTDVKQPIANFYREPWVVTAFAVLLRTLDTYYPGWSLKKKATRKTARAHHAEEDMMALEILVAMMLGAGAKALRHRGGLEEWLVMRALRAEDWYSLLPLHNSARAALDSFAFVVAPDMVSKAFYDFASGRKVR
ncbi:MAG: DUF262 domain-containing protein [Sutterella sp.]|nr:DUF262 domain-containing protein [Sutterella sp.]